MTLEIDRIYCGDCLDLMREMPDKSVDTIITDPPFFLPARTLSVEERLGRQAVLRYICAAGFLGRLWSLRPCGF